MGRVNGISNILKIDSDEEQNTAMEKAQQVLLSGGIVAYPTESFYGLAVDIKNEEAIEKLFALKNRDSGKPILILLPEIDDLKKYVEDIQEHASKLINEFWPGGLTMLFKANSQVSPLLTAGTGKIGVRYSSHPIATTLARSIGRPITGTSSNISGFPPCIRAKEVYEYFGETVDLILDDGVTKGGKGSTILDVTIDPPVILREGMVLKKEIEKIPCKLA